MKLQIEGQHVRIRIDEDELARLLSGATVASHTQFADAFAMHYDVRLNESTARFEGRPEAWQIFLPEAAVRAHAVRLPTREGLRFTLTGKGDGDALELLFDVDVRDSVKRRRSPPP